MLHPRLFSSLPFSSVQFSSVAQLCPTLCDPMNCSTNSFTNSLPLPSVKRIKWECLEVWSLLELLRKQSLTDKQKYAVRFNFSVMSPLTWFVSPFTYVSVLAVCRNAVLQGLLTAWLCITRFRPQVYGLVFVTVRVSGLSVSGTWMPLVFLQGRLLPGYWILFLSGL